MADKRDNKITSTKYLNNAVSFSPSTHVCWEKFLEILPQITIFIGAVFLITGIILTVLSYSTSYSYDKGVTSGPVLMVLGTLLTCCGILWLMYNIGTKRSYKTQNQGGHSGFTNPSYGDNLSQQAYPMSYATNVPNSINKEQTTVNFWAMDNIRRSNTDVVLDNIGYVPAQKEDWQTGDIYRPNVI